MYCKIHFTIIEDKNNERLKDERKKFSSAISDIIENVFLYYANCILR